MKYVIFAMGVTLWTIMNKSVFGLTGLEGVMASGCVGGIISYCLFKKDF